MERGVGLLRYDISASSSRHEIAGRLAATDDPIHRARVQIIRLAARIDYPDVTAGGVGNRRCG